MQILGAKGLLVNITGSSSLTMHEVHTAISCIQKAAGADANLIHGVVESEAMGEDISITVVATGFSQPLTSTTNTQEDSNEAFRNTTAHHVVNVNRSPQIQSSRTEDRQSDQTVVPQQIAAQPGSVDQNDIEVPAYWRRQGNSRHTEHVVQQNHVPARANTQQIPTPTPQATMASTPLPASPKLQSNQQTDSLTSQPEAFPRPRAKSASAGGGSKDPAFLRRIMD